MQAKLYQDIIYEIVSFAHKNDMQNIRRVSMLFYRAVMFVVEKYVKNDSVSFMVKCANKLRVPTSRIFFAISHNRYLPPKFGDVVLAKIIISINNYRKEIIACEDGWQRNMDDSDDDIICVEGLFKTSFMHCSYDDDQFYRQYACRFVDTKKKRVYYVTFDVVIYFVESYADHPEDRPHKHSEEDNMYTFVSPKKAKIKKIDTIIFLKGRNETIVRYTSIGGAKKYTLIRGTKTITSYIVELQRYPTITFFFVVISKKIYQCIKVLM